MTKPNHPTIRVLSIDPSPEGFGFAVLEEPTRLVDWGVAQVWSASPRAFLSRVEAFVDRYQPAIIVLEDISKNGKRQRAARRTASVVHYARSRRIAVTKVNRAQIRAAFGKDVTKYDIALAISGIFPELTPRLPPKRKLWQTESERMNIFDALSFALTALARVPAADESAAA